MVHACVPFGGRIDKLIELRAGGVAILPTAPVRRWGRSDLLVVGAYAAGGARTTSMSARDPGSPGCRFPPRIRSMAPRGRCLIFGAERRPEPFIQIGLIWEAPAAQRNRARQPSLII